MNTLEAARPQEEQACWAILREGREFQKEQGFVQWTDSYPNLETVRGDIRDGKGFVLKVDGRIAAYMCVDFDGEPAYDVIEGEWGTEEPYAVVHRMAFAREFRGMGLTAAAFSLIERLCLSRGVKSLRADTDFPNERMQHVLEKNGFEKRGVVVFQGSGKLAYDKTLA